jgi:hypothetical protein
MWDTFFVSPRLPSPTLHITDDLSGTRRTCRRMSGVGSSSDLPFGPCSKRGEPVVTLTMTDCARSNDPTPVWHYGELRPRPNLDPC